MRIKRFSEFIEELKCQYVDEYSIFDDTLDDFNLSLIPKDRLKKQYVNFKFNRVLTEFGRPVSEIGKKLILREGVNETYDIIEVKESLSKKYGLDDWQFIIKDGENDIKIALVIPHISMNEDFIVEDMYVLGYYENYREYEEEDGLTYTIIKFDPIYPKDITDNVRKMTFIKHLTPKYNLESIKQNGFKPYNKNLKFNYPPRLHFLKEGIDIKNIKYLAKQLNELNNDIRNNGEYVLFTLDVSKIPNNVKFIGDTCYKFGICTYEHVSYDTVINIQECNCKDNNVIFKINK